MGQDLATQIVTELAGGAGKALTTAGAEALTRLIDGLKEKFRRQPAEQDTLETFLNDPENAAARAAFLARLQALCLSDPLFRAWLEQRQAALMDGERAGHTTNDISGHVEGNAVQARDIAGDITFG